LTFQKCLHQKLWTFKVLGHPAMLFIMSYPGLLDTASQRAKYLFVRFRKPPDGFHIRQGQFTLKGPMRKMFIILGFSGYPILCCLTLK